VSNVGKKIKHDPKGRKSSRKGSEGIKAKDVGRIQNKSLANTLAQRMGKTQSQNERGRTREKKTASKGKVM